MGGLIGNFPYTGVVTVNRVILKAEYAVDELQERGGPRRPPPRATRGRV